MFPPPIETDLPAFMFVRDNQICCFGRKPKVYDKLGVKMKEGATTHYIQGHPFDGSARSSTSRESSTASSTSCT